MRDSQEVLSLTELGALRYNIVGSGGFTRRLIQLLRNRGGRLPEWVITTDGSTVEVEGIAAITLDDARPEDLETVVLGSDVFQLELMRKVQRRTTACRILNLSEEVQASIRGDSPYPLPRTCPDTPYALFIALIHSEFMLRWLGNFHRALIRAGITLVTRHPQERISDEEMRNAAFVFAWNGSTPHFDGVHAQLRRLGLKLSYAECGFFPQAEHFYFDRLGINNDSQLNTDPLDWVSRADMDRLNDYRQRLFGNRLDADGGNFVFVPLQLAADSNIQLHSRFTNGMQEYIDFVAGQHPNDALIFKPHPRDPNPNSYHYHHGSRSDDDTLGLIARSRLVRGINSGVLFEAALFGNTVIVDGESLLKHTCNDQQRVIAAMIARQYNVRETQLDLDKLRRFSHMAPALEHVYEQ